MSAQNRIGLILVAVVVISIAALVFNRDTQASGESSIGDVSVSCGPSQRAVVQKSGSGASAQVSVLCVDASGMQPMAYSAQEAGPLTPVAHATAPAAALPAVMYAPMPVAQVAPQIQASSAPVRRVERKPSWQKRAIVIGGTAGAGAGLGALVGGKKGALIGAAIGGGGAAIVDQVKHR
ncbi:MAG: hypothetical protein IT183_13815 [Acidobacteria bacterium]|nr:hypothetical protein [Acidobacteriota bacterium]